MPRPFNQQEQDAIRSSLIAAGARLFRTRGVQRTTVDELAAAAGIAKGSFYKFYESKELLFFEILEQKNEDIRRPLLENASVKDRQARSLLAERLRSLLGEIADDPLFLLMGNDAEYRALMRRLPPDRLRAHQQLDRGFLEQFIDCWSAGPARPNRDVVAARVTSAVLICLRHDFFGEALFPLALEAAAESIVACFFDRAT